jgi:hypothetical protein
MKIRYTFSMNVTMVAKLKLQASPDASPPFRDGVIDCR